MKKYLLAVLIITIPLIMTGCTSKKEKYNMYQSDNQSINTINEYIAFIGDITYRNDLSEDDKIYNYNVAVDNFNQINMKTKEGKKIKATYEEVINYYLNIVYQNPNSSDVSSIIENDPKSIQLSNKLNEQIAKFNKKYDKAEDTYNSSGKIRKTIAVILGFIIGTLIFLLLNSLFDIYYFGCMGAVGLWFITCYIVATIIGLILGVDIA